MVGTQAVYQVFFRVVCLAGRAVEPRVGAFVDVAGVIAALDELLDKRFVFRIGGADKEVVACSHLPRDFPELTYHLVGVLLGRKAPGRRGLFYLRAMLIGPSEEKDVVSQLAMKARRYIGGRSGVGVTDVRHIVNVIDWRSDVELAHSRAILTDGLSRAMSACCGV